MINFINTDLFKDNETIKVTVYSDDVNRTYKYVNLLAIDEDIIDSYEDYNGNYTVEIKKDSLTIKITTKRLSEHGNGYRTNYAFIDKNFLCSERNLEIFMVNTYNKIIIYPYQLKDEYVGISKAELNQIMLF